MSRQIRKGVNFINILRKKFSYENCFGNFLYVHVTGEKVPKQRLYEKFECKMLMKLTVGTKCCKKLVECKSKDFFQYGLHALRAITLLYLISLCIKEKIGFLLEPTINSDF